MSSRPTASEYAANLKRYIDLVAEEDITRALEKQGMETAWMLRRIGPEKASHRYEPEKWSVKQVVQHIVDAERIFSYRALSIARGETLPLPRFEEKDYAAASDADRRNMEDLADEYEAVRRATVALVRGLPPEAWKRVGTASQNPASVRALAYATLGHERHHLRILRERYGI